MRDFVLCSASGEDMLCCITVEHENDVSDQERETGVLSSFFAVLLSSAVQSTWSP